MAFGNRIVISEQEHGHRTEGIISGTPKPGTCVLLKNVAVQNGKTWTWEPFGATAASGNNGVAADGDQRMIAVLDVDYLQGRIATTAYANEERVPIYFPVPGEELNMIFQNISGTGDDQDVVIGDQLMVDDGTGKLLVADNNAEAEPFQALEALTDVAADVLLRVMFTGY